MGIDLFQLIEVNRAIARIIDIRRQRKRLIRGPDSACNKAGSTIFRLIFISSLSGNCRRLAVHVSDQRFGIIIRLADLVRVKTIGRNHIRTRIQIGAGNGINDIGTGQYQKVIIAFLIVTQLILAPIGGLIKIIALNHCAKSTICQQDTLACFFPQMFCCYALFHDRFSLSAAFHRLDSRSCSGCHYFQATGCLPKRRQRAEVISARFMV